MMAVSIIIPTLNEAENIGPLVKQIFSVMQKNSIIAEIIIIDDGSRDGTCEIIRKLAEHHPVHLTSRVDKHGLASAVIEGADTAGHETVVVMDGDLSHSPEDIPRLAEAVSTEKCDIAIGSRYAPGGETPGWPRKRRLASQLASFPARLLTGIDDPLSGFFAVSRNKLRALRGDVPGYKICLELLLGQKRNMKVMEFPITFRDRRAGASKMDGSIIFSYLAQLCSVCGLSVSADFFRLFVLSMFFGVSTDLLIYYGSSALQQSLIVSQAIAAICSAMAVFFTARFFSQDRAGYQELLLRPYSFLLLFLFVIVRVRIYDCILNSIGDDTLIWVSAVATAFISTTVTALFFIVIVPANNPESLNQGLRLRLTLIGVICISLFLRILFAGSFELLQEEVYYWNYAQHLDFGYLDHPPMVAILIKTGILLFGNTELAVRISALFCWCLATVFIFLYTREMSNRDNALRSAAIMALLPAFFIFGFLMTPDAPLIACWAGVLFFARRAIVRGDQKSWLWIGVMLGLGLTSKYTIALVVPALFVFLLSDANARHWLLRPKPYIAAAVALIIFSPVIVWNMEHNWASFLFQTHNRLISSSEFSLHELLASIAALLSPVGLFALLFFFFQRKRFIDQDESSRRNYNFVFTMITIPLSVFVIFSLNKEVKFNWTSPIWLAVIPYLASTFSQEYDMIRSRTHDLFYKAWKATIFILLIAYGGLFHYFSAGIPGVPYLTGGPLLGWEHFSAQLESLVDAVEKQTGQRPPVVGADQYKTASGLAFYRTRRFEKDHKPERQHPLTETIGRSILGRDAVMYDYWDSARQYSGATLLLVSPDKADLNPKWLAGTALQTGDVYELQAMKNHQNVGPLFYRFISAGKQTKKMNVEVTMDSKTKN